VEEEEEEEEEEEDSPIGTRMVNAGCIREKTMNDALQDHVRVTC